MTAIAQGRERAVDVADSRAVAPAPEQTPDQAEPISRPGDGAPGPVANGQGRARASAESVPPAPAPAYHELRVFAELYADVQQARIACANRAERGGLDPTILAAYLAGLRESEHKLGLAMVRCYRRVVDPAIREWQQATPGIGEHLLARLLGTIGHPRHATPYHWEGSGSERVLIADPPFERNVAKLWSYCGHGDPSRKRRKGMTAEEGAALGNPRAKMLVHLLAEAAMKCVGSASEERATSGGSSQPTRARSPYRDVYEQGRATYATREGWTPARQHAAALRLVGKEILRDLWVVSG